MKVSTKTFAVAMLATLFTGMFLGSMLTWKCGRKTATFTPRDTTLVMVYKTDTTVCYDTIVVAQHDTVFVTPDTPISQIPVRTQEAAFYVPVDVNTGKVERWNIPLIVSTTYRGILYRNTVRALPEPYTIEISDKKPFLDLYGTVAAGVNHALHPITEIELGATAFQKAVIFGRLSSTLDDGVLRWQTMAGAKWILF